MAGVFRLGFRAFAPRERWTAPHDMHWSLATLDPAANVLSGTFEASDRALVPYRLWRAKEPRALVLLLHGAFDYSGAFDEIGPKLAAHGLTALAIDQRGFGATKSRGYWRGKRRLVRDAIEAVLFLRMRFGALPTFIVGESMGAAVAVHAATRAPDLDLAGLVLAAPGAIAGTLRRLFSAFVARLLNRIFPQSEIVMERISAWDLTASSAIRLLSDPLVLRAAKPATVFGLLDLSAHAVDIAHRVTVPTLTMVGTKEDVLRTTCIQLLHHGLSGDKEWEEFEGGPHLLFHWQHGERVLARTLAFIDKHLPAVAEAQVPGIKLSA
jgi:alpha-beta hydrolase superfamily lysophospholipase